MEKKLVQFIAGIIVALVGAAIIFHGSLLGESNLGIAMIISFTGIVLIATSRYKMDKIYFFLPLISLEKI